LATKKAKKVDFMMPKGRLKGVAVDLEYPLLVLFGFGRRLKNERINFICVV
jgi:hypothetical protein